jgi:hypothetical protein
MVTRKRMPRCNTHWGCCIKLSLEAEQISKPVLHNA